MPEEAAGKVVETGGGNGKTDQSIDVGEIIADFAPAAKEVPVVVKPEEGKEAIPAAAKVEAKVEEEVVETVFKLQPAKPERFRGVFNTKTQELVHPEALKFKKEKEADSASEASAPASSQLLKQSHPKVGRNDPCPCGSGKKHKKCCGK